MCECECAGESIIPFRFAGIVCAHWVSASMSSAIHYTLFQTNLNVQSFIRIVGAGTGEHGFSTKWFVSRRFGAGNLRRPQSTTHCILVYSISGWQLRQNCSKMVVNVMALYAVRTCGGGGCDRKQLQTNVILLLRKTNWTTIFIVHCSMYPGATAKYNTSTAYVGIQCNAPVLEWRTRRRYQQNQQHTQ